MALIKVVRKRVLDWIDLDRSIVDDTRSTTKSLFGIKYYKELYVEENHIPEDKDEDKQIGFSKRK